MFEGVDLLTPGGVEPRVLAQRLEIGVQGGGHPSPRRLQGTPHLVADGPAERGIDLVEA